MVISVASGRRLVVLLRRGRPKRATLLGTDEL